MNVSGHNIVLISLVGGFLDRDVLGAGRRPLLVPLHGLGPSIERPGQSLRFCFQSFSFLRLGGSAAALCAHLFEPTFINKALLLPRRGLASVEQLRR